MRGKADPQSILFIAAIDLEQRVRPDHPLRAVKRMVDEDLKAMSRRFDAAYAAEGRPSVPPERLIKALLLQSIYSIRSEAQLVERIDHDLLFRWFLDLRIDEEVFDATVFSHNRGRLEEHGLIGAFFDGTVRAECLNQHWFMSLSDAKEKIEAWRKDYNEARPHESLGYLAPNEFARSSQVKQWPERL